MSGDRLRDLIESNRIEDVEADPEAAELLLEEAALHLDSARRIAEVDPNGAYQLLYDTARKAISAHMLASGYRATNRQGAHEATGRYAEAMLSDEPAVREFDRIRRSRNRSEYSIAMFDSNVIAEDLEHAGAIVDAATRELEH